MIRQMTYVEAAEAVLRSARRPLTLGEITEAALRRRFIEPRGRTPQRTMSAALYRHIRRYPRGRIRREYRPGRIRAARDSVRWAYAE